MKKLLIIVAIASLASCKKNESRCRTCKNDVNLYKEVFCGTDKETEQYIKFTYDNKRKTLTCD